MSGSGKTVFVILDTPLEYVYLEQAVRRILLKKYYGGDVYLGFQHGDESQQLPAEEVDAKQLVAGYCLSLYEKYGSYEAVSRIVKLDRRTVKKHIQS